MFGSDRGKLTGQFNEAGRFLFTEQLAVLSFIATGLIILTRLALKIAQQPGGRNMLVPCMHVWMCAFAPSSVTLTEWEQLQNDHSHNYFPPFSIDTRCIEHRCDTPFVHCSRVVEKQPVDSSGSRVEM